MSESFVNTLQFKCLIAINSFLSKSLYKSEKTDIKYYECFKSNAITNNSIIPQVLAKLVRIRIHDPYNNLDLIKKSKKLNNSVTLLDYLDNYYNELDSASLSKSENIACKIKAFKILIGYNKNAVICYFNMFPYTEYGKTDLGLNHTDNLDIYVKYKQNIFEFMKREINKYENRHDMAFKNTRVYLDLQEEDHTETIKNILKTKGNKELALANEVEFTRMLRHTYGLNVFQADEICEQLINSDKHYDLPSNALTIDEFNIKNKGYVLEPLYNLYYVKKETIDLIINYAKNELNVNLKPQVNGIKCELEPCSVIRDLYVMKDTNYYDTINKLKKKFTDEYLYSVSYDKTVKEQVAFNGIDSTNEKISKHVKITIEPTEEELKKMQEHKLLLEKQKKILEEQNKKKKALELKKVKKTAQATKQNGSNSGKSKKK